MSFIIDFFKRDRVMAVCIFVALGVLSFASVVAARSAQSASVDAAKAARQAATTADVASNVQAVQEQIRMVVSNSQSSSALFLTAYTTYTKCLKLIPAGDPTVVAPEIDACAVSSGLLPAKK